MLLAKRADDPVTKFRTYMYVRTYYTYPPRSVRGLTFKCGT